MNGGDTAFVLLSAALVFLMIPGVAFFYAGLGSRKNLVNNMTSSISVVGLSTIMWVLLGYSLTFGESILGFIGKLDFSSLSKNFTFAPSPYANGIPSSAFIIFQMMFALLTPALIVGAIEGRMRFKALFLFLPLWSLFVYYPVTHMNWAKGGLLGAEHMGAVDFAGGNVVHISSGVTGLVLAMLLGKRKEYRETTYHNVPFVLLGTILLWFGWLGFNSGSALSANSIAAHAFLTTMVSASSAFLVWIFLSVIRKRRAKLTSACVGAIVGLVSITPGAGYVPVWASIIIGAFGAIFSYIAVRLVRRKFKIDDVSDVFACHGVGGIWGGIATGIFSNPNINSAVKQGLIFGKFSQFLAQFASIIVTIIVVFVGTLICSYITSAFTKLRASEKEEESGMDISQHEEEAYYA
ncbi:MAG: ammonium transporter [Oscillospiraceae bacterium]|nr:ammonium transporter [Oscillospiraceae bacterium]